MKENAEILLLPWTKERKPDLVALCNGVDKSFLSGRLPHPYTDEDGEWWLNQVEKHEGKRGLFRAVLFGGKIVGSISVEKKADVFFRDAELGYMLCTDHWSRGIMTEAVRQITDLAFSSLDLMRISAQVYAPNRASARVLEKTGYRLEGCLRRAACKGEEVMDVLLYGILKEEWQK